MDPTWSESSPFKFRHISPENVPSSHRSFVSSVLCIPFMDVHHIQCLAEETRVVPC